MRAPELLVPAGCPARLQAAIGAGADAVYLSGQHFGLRKNAENFTDRELAQAIALARARKVKTYITCNVLPLERDLPQLRNYLGQLAQLRPDALLVACPGVASLARELTGLPLHLSTQASCLSSATARFWRAHGISRIVLGRECSIQEAASIAAQAEVEVELFVHGSLCTALSGKCVISNYSVGRDANRGGCVQTCRNDFHFVDGAGTPQQAPIMNAHDLAGLQLLPQLISAGINSLKIEGRMKSIGYVTTTTSVYRRAIDACLACQRDGCDLAELPWAQWQAELASLANRGYCSGGLQSGRGDDASINDQFTGTHSQRRFAGSVVATDDQLGLILEVKELFDSSTRAGWQLPRGPGPIARLQGMRDMAGEALTRAPPSRLVRLPYTAAVPVGSLLYLDEA